MVRAIGLHSEEGKALLLCTTKRVCGGTEPALPCVRTGLREEGESGGHDRAQVEAAARRRGRVDAYILNGAHAHQVRARRGKMNIHLEQRRRRGLQIHISATGRGYRPIPSHSPAKA